MKNKLFCLLAAAALLLGFASCNKEEEETPGGDTPEQQGRLYVCDELVFVLNNLCILDNQLEVKGYYAERKDSVLAPNELYMIAQTPKEAKAIMRQWLPKYARGYVTNDGTVAKLYNRQGQLECTLTMEFPQGGRELAVVSFSSHRYEAAVHSVHFLTEEVWGENGMSTSMMRLEGRGNEESPYLIHDYAEFRRFLNTLPFVAPGDMAPVVSAACYRLEGDIDCGGDTILIPTFEGVFDGNGHAIRNYNMAVFDKPYESLGPQSTCRKAMGLFYDMNCAIVKNLKLYPNACTLAPEVQCFGLLTPWVNFAEVDKVNVYNAEVDGTVTSDGFIGGGLLGMVWGSLLAIDIRVSYENGYMEADGMASPVTLTNSTVDADYKLRVQDNADAINFGGLVGRDEKAEKRWKSNNAPYKKCTVNGVIRIHRNAGTFDATYVDGLLGYPDTRRSYLSGTCKFKGKLQLLD